MSSASTPKALGTRAIQVFALLAAFGVMFAVNRLTPNSEDGIGRITAVGFLLLAGTLTSELFEMVKLPHLSGYLVAGIFSGPHVLHLLDHQTVAKVAPVNTLALSLIALAGGAELRFGTLKRVARSLAISTVVQSGIILVGMAGLFLLLSRYVPFASSMPTRALLGVALLWGVMSVTRSPSACLGILSKTRAKGLRSTTTARPMGKATPAPHWLAPAWLPRHRSSEISSSEDGPPIHAPHQHYPAQQQGNAGPLRRRQ